MGLIKIVGLGAGDIKQMTLGIYETLLEAEQVWLRTRLHPVVESLEGKGINMHSFDDLYEKDGRFEQVYGAIHDALIRLADEKETPVVYAVPGHPLVAEKTVQLLLQSEQKGEVDVEILGGQSFLDPLFSRLRIDPIEGISVLDGTSLTKKTLSPHLHTFICQVYDSFVASEVKLTLMELYPDDYSVTVVTAVGVKNREKVRNLPLYELDRMEGIDNLTLVYVPPTDSKNVLSRRFDFLYEIVAALRDPEGCPWDREQTHESIRKNLIEETYEVLETIDEQDPESICEELGDLLMQVMLRSRMAEEEGFFNVDDVVGALSEKLIRRHPHVFGDKKHLFT